MYVCFFTFLDIEVTKESDLRWTDTTKRDDFLIGGVRAPIEAALLH